MKIETPDGLSLQGSITIPDIITYKMFRAFYKAYNEKLPESEDNTMWGQKWRAAVVLLGGWGTFDIEGLPHGEFTADGDGVPLDVYCWIGGVVDSHLGELLAFGNVKKNALKR